MCRGERWLSQRHADAQRARWILEGIVVPEDLAELDTLLAGLGFADQRAA